MWLLYVNEVYVCKSDNISRVLDVVRAFMYCESIVSITLRPELPF